MNFKKYFLINLKQYLVLYIVSFALFATTAVSCVMTFSMYDMTSVQCVEGICAEMPDMNILGDLGILGVLNSPLMSMFLVLFILMLIMPIFAMGARYSLNASDTYKQVAQKRNAIRLTNNLTLLLSIMVIFTVVYWLMVAGLAIRHAYAKIPEDSMYCYFDEFEGLTYCNGTKYSKVSLNFGVFGVMYPFIIILAMLQYFISYLFVSRCNRPINSIFTLIMGELALALIMYSIINYANSIIVHQINDYINQHPGAEYEEGIYDRMINQLTGTGNSSALLPMMFLITYFTPLISGAKNGFESITNAQTAILAVSMSIFFIIAALGVFAMIFEKDPSGEFAGKPESPRPYQYIIFHIGAFAVGFVVVALLAASGLIAFLVLEVFVAALYYVFLGVMRRNFKINLANLIPLVSITVANFALGLILYFVAG